MMPSWEDQDLTDHFIQAGKFLNIEVIDHLVISDETYYGFVDSGIFKKLQASEKWVLPYKLKEKIRNEGIEIGEEKGRREEKIEIATAMKQKEISMTIIAETSGLSIQEIKEL